MSFNVNWNTLETDSLRSWTIDLLTDALNSGKRPNILASDIAIKDLNFGKAAPNFEILEIGELGKDRFRGIFKITYNGEFHLTLHTKVQANPLKIYSDSSLDQEVSSDPFITPDFLLSVDPFNLPMDLKLSDIKISGIGIIVFSKSKGLTLVFRNDPLDSIKVSSTFDTVQVLANFLQKQIENQIRDLFRETLPTLIHKVSLKYTSTFTNNDFMDNLKDHLNAESHSNMLDSLDLENIAANNLSKLAKLHSTRETLNFNVPKFKKIVQRNHLEKFNKNMYPNLFNSLHSNLNLSVSGDTAPNTNSIPVQLLVNDDFKKVDEILGEIVNIQTRSFTSANNDHKVASRRKIKLGRKSKSDKDRNVAKPQEQFSDCKMAESTTVYSDALSDVSTVASEEHSRIEHPTPVKIRPAVRPQLQTTLVAKYNACPSPLSSNSSFVGSVGLGNSFFNITNGHALSASPLRKEPVKPLSADEEKTLKVKKSLNRIDIKKINEKLQQHMKLDEEHEIKERVVRKAVAAAGEKVSASADKLGTSNKLSAIGDDSYGHHFELPPPPYYQLPRV